MRRLILATGIMFVLAAPAFATTNRDGNWQGDVQCEESPYYTFRVAVTDGRFAHTDHNLSIQGTISHDRYKVRGCLKSGGKLLHIRLPRRYRRGLHSRLQLWQSWGFMLGEINSSDLTGGTTGARR